MFTVGIDTRAFDPGFKAHYGRGTGRYGTELISALTEIAPSIPELRMSLLSSTQLSAQGWQKQAVSLLPFGKVTAETQLFLPQRFRRCGCDGVHFLAHGDAPAWMPIPYVVTVLDLIPLRFADLYAADKPGWRFRFARSLEQRAIENASGILAISEATKRDLVELLGIDPERIVVTPLAVSGRFAPREPGADPLGSARAKLSERWNLPPHRPIILYVGGIDPRKNVPFLIGAFAQLLGSLTQQGTREDLLPLLVLAGNISKDDQYPRLCARIRSEGVEDSVAMLGFVPEDDLLPLYHGATVFAFPSLYEGFGLPVLEAMAAGVAVVAGANSSIPEVTGENGCLLPDSDTGAWIAAFEALLNDNGRRRDLEESGAKRARMFSWQRTAERTLEGYGRFLGAPGFANAATGKPRSLAAG